MQVQGHKLNFSNTWLQTGTCNSLYRVFLYQDRQSKFQTRKLGFKEAKEHAWGTKLVESRVANTSLLTLELFLLHLHGVVATKLKKLVR